MHILERSINKHKINIKRKKRKKDERVGEKNPELAKNDSESTAVKTPLLLVK